MNLKRRLERCEERAVEVKAVGPRPLILIPDNGRGDVKLGEQGGGVVIYTPGGPFDLNRRDTAGEGNE